MLLYLFRGKLPWQIMNKVSVAEHYDHAKEIKEQYTPEMLCEGKGKPLLPLFEECYSYKFEDEPNYAQLKHMFIVAL